jgi:polyisoprenoid-binding protein YceI
VSDRQASTHRPAGVHALRRGVFALVLLAAPFTADAALSKHGTAEVAFDARATGGLAIRGTTNDLRVQEQGQHVVVTVPLASLTTGIALRDKHMRDKYLEVAKYPEAKLKVPRSSLAFPSASSPSSRTLDGHLTIHGRTRPTSFRYKASRHGDVFRVAGSVRVDMTDHGIEQPSFMGVKVAKEVNVNVRFEVKDP